MNFSFAFLLAFAATLLPAPRVGAVELPPPP